MSNQQHTVLGFFSVNHKNQPISECDFIMTHVLLSLTQKLQNECLKLNDVAMMIYASSNWGNNLLVERQPLLLQEVILHKLMFHESYFPSGAVLITFLVEDRSSMANENTAYTVVNVLVFSNLFHMLFFERQVIFLVSFCCMTHNDQFFNH